MSRPKKLLCVDDQDAILSTQAIILRQAGYDVLTAANATEAIRRVNEQTIDLVVLDRCLPECDGAELIPFIRASNPRTAIVLSSADCTKQPDVNELAADAIVYKPCPPADLLQTVRRCV